MDFNKPKKELFTRASRSGPEERRFDQPQFLFCLLLIAAMVFVLYSGVFTRAENFFLDSFFRARKTIQVHPDILLIDIDDESLDAIGKWPWPLDYHARMLRFLSGAGARVIIYDAMMKASGVMTDASAGTGTLEDLRPYYLPVALEAKPEKKIYVHDLPIVLEPEGPGEVWVHSPAAVEKNAAGLGHRELSPDGDGVLRRIRPVISADGESFPFLAIPAVSGHGLKQIPLDEQKRLIVNWPGRWQQAYDRVSFQELVRIFQAPSGSSADQPAPERFRGKICLVGVTASGAGGNTVVGPLEPSLPEPAVQAAVLNSFLTGRFIRPVSQFVRLLCLVAVGVLAALLFAFQRNVIALLTGLGLGAVWVVVCFVLFSAKGLWLGAFHPLLLISVLFVFSALYSHMVSGQERKRLFNLATRDGLTGLYVIRHFREILNQAVRQAHRQREPLSVLLLDIDNFKPINDTYGHPCGDMVLKKAAEAVQSCVRSNRSVQDIDFVARYGGEEFIVLLRRTRLSDAADRAAERIRKKIEETAFQWNNVAIPVTVSIGVAALRFHESVPDPMVHRADVALYQAKRNGKNRVCAEK